MKFKSLFGTSLLATVLAATSSFGEALDAQANLSKEIQALLSNPAVVRSLQTTALLNYGKGHEDAVRKAQQQARELGVPAILSDDPIQTCKDEELAHFASFKSPLPEDALMFFDRVRSVSGSGVNAGIASVEDLKQLNSGVLQRQRALLSAPKQYADLIQRLKTGGSYSESEVRELNSWVVKTSDAKSPKNDLTVLPVIPRSSQEPSVVFHLQKQGTISVIGSLTVEEVLKGFSFESTDRKPSDKAKKAFDQVNDIYLQTHLLDARSLTCQKFFNVASEANPKFKIGQKDLVQLQAEMDRALAPYPELVVKELPQTAPSNASAPNNGFSGKANIML